MLLLSGSVGAVGAVGVVSADEPPAPASTASAGRPWQTVAADLKSKAITFLRSQQDATSGGWSVPKPGTPAPHLPAITGLILSGMLAEQSLGADDPTIKKGLAYAMGFIKPDGGIYDTILPTYNTAIVLSALAKVDTPEARQAIKPAQEFLKRSQWGTTEPVGVGGAGGKESPAIVDKSHPNYGGIGYGNRGRPDISNTGFALEAWRTSGLPSEDPAYQRALVFLQRLQMLEKTADGKPINTMPYAKGSRQGGFIYATGENDKTVGQGNSFAGVIDETLSTGETKSMLRSYGSVTYLGFKSYLYAGLRADDPRVVAAVNWAKANWSLDENPGIGTDGYYYYIVMMSRALAALGVDTLAVAPLDTFRTTVVVKGLKASTTEADVRAAVAALDAAAKVSHVELDAKAGLAMVIFAEEANAKKLEALLGGTAIDGAKVTASMKPPIAAPGTTQSVAWREALVSKLAKLQRDDGSFATVDDRWMENNQVLTTAYVLIALQEATASRGR